MTDSPLRRNATAAQMRDEAEAGLVLRDAIKCIRPDQRAPKIIDMLKQIPKDEAHATAQIVEREIDQWRHGRLAMEDT